MTETKRAPVEPTEEMWQAGMRVLEDRGNSPFAFRAALKAMLAAAPPDDELARLEREIATEAAICAIEHSCLPTREGTERCDPLWFDLATARDDVASDVRYLELRGLLERHPDNSNLVRVKEGEDE